MVKALLIVLAGVVLGACGASEKPSALDAPATGAESEADLAADRAVMDKARQLLARERAGEAEELLTAWIENPEKSNSRWRPEALYLRGNAHLAQEDEVEALYDYEKVAKNYPGSEVFPLVLQQELEIARMYLGGLRKKTLGLRIDSGLPYAEEIVLRINERLPGSTLAETALLELADHYYKARDLPMAAETYDVFLSLYPRSAHRSKALQRRAFANIAQYKGPRHDASGLADAKYQIEDFQREFPLDAERLGMSDALQARLDESAAEQILVTAKWHLDRGDDPAGQYVLYRLMRRYPGSGAAREGLAIFEERGWTFPQPEPVAEEPAVPAPSGAPAAEPAP